ncbi:MAG: hypothetical protein OXK76_09860 [Gammaproteobacteria bacterium]|nr:hypothetical protein [Gammaproteobacteria bacterium]
MSDGASVRIYWAVGVAVGLVLVMGLVVISRVDPMTDDSTMDSTLSGRSETITPTSAGPSLAEAAGIRDDFARNAALYRLAHGATREQVEGWLAEVETLPGTPHAYDVARVLYIRFTVLDPQAALDHALRGATKPVWLAAIFRTWAQLDPDAAVARAAILHPSAKSPAMRVLLQRELPPADLRSVAARLDETVDHHWYRNLEAFHGVAPPTPAERALAEIEARRLARRNGESHADAWTRAIGIEDDAVRQILAEQTAIDWSAEDPRAALAALESVPLDDMVATGRPPSGGVSIAPLRMRIGESIIGKWARADPRAALAWILESTGDARGWYIQRPMIELARQAPEQAIASLAAIPEELRRSATGAVLRTFAYRDLDHALELFAQLEVGEKASQTHTLRRLLIERRSAHDALGWAMSVDHRIRGREVSAVIRDVHRDDRVEGLRLLESIGDPAMRTTAALELVWREVRHDAQGAYRWARNFKPEDGRSRLVVKVFRVWASHDASAASRALLEHRGGPLRDEATVSVMSDVIGHDIHLAERLFEAIEAPGQQAEAADLLYRHFTENAPNRRKAERYRKYLAEDDADA